MSSESTFDHHHTVDLLERTRDLREQFVRPFYLKLLHANFMRPESDAASFSSHFATAATTISDQQIGALLEVPEWRGRLTAAWIIGVTRRKQFVDQIADLLIPSRLTYAGQGYCVALGLIGDDRCREHLIHYLNEYLPLHGRIYDQEWAIGALAHLSEVVAVPFQSPALWSGSRLDPATGIARYSRLVQYLSCHQMFLLTMNH